MYNLFLRLKLHNYKIIRPKMNLSKEIKREREREFEMSLGSKSSNN